MWKEGVPPRPIALIPQQVTTDFSGPLSSNFNQAIVSGEKCVSTQESPHTEVQIETLENIIADKLRIIS
jgi:methionine-rich copper-binding protein CopC